MVDDSQMNIPGTRKLGITGFDLGSPEGTGATGRLVIHTDFEASLPTLDRPAALRDLLIFLPNVGICAYFVHRAIDRSDSSVQPVPFPA
jgi:hypothetical protein